MGTAFQGVDDLVDFCEDLGEGGTNLVISRAYHNGTAKEQKRIRDYLREITDKGHSSAIFGDAKFLTEKFGYSARAVLSEMEKRVTESFSMFRDLGLEMNPEDAPAFVRAITGEIDTSYLEKFPDD
jgi:predicted deacetylase